MRHHLQFIRLVFVAVVLFSLSAVVAGQEVSGSISGTVKDSMGAAVAGAPATLPDTQKKVVARTLTTNDEGAFSAPDMQSGVYDIAVESPNFKKHIEKG